ncbi:MAG: UDP-2,3-diacylglucosamine diphosphatase [Cyclobacteriaceae bacterium]
MTPINTFAEFPKGKKIYFASDFHLGAPDFDTSLQREKKIIRWLDQISNDALAVFLVGDIFDFWFEYKHSIPKGHIRIQGKLAELSDKGISIVIFTGNHDMWMFDYFKQQFGAVIHRNPQCYNLGGRRVLIGHGDGLGPGDSAYKIYKKVFQSPICQWLFKWLHPDVGMSIAKYWSAKSRMNNSADIEHEAEWLIEHCNDIEDIDHHDFYVFGHRHLATKLQLNENSIYINLGEWIEKCTYAVFDGNSFELNAFDK